MKKYLGGFHLTSLEFLASILLCICCHGVPYRGLASPAPAGALPSPSHTATSQAAFEQRNEHMQALERFSRALEALQKTYVDPKINVNDLVNNAIEGMTKGLDPHTMALNKEQWAALTTDTKGKFGGLGVSVAPLDGRLEIVEILPNTPAAKSPLAVGDIIVSVDGLKHEKDNGDTLLNMMRGAPGSKVVLIVEKGAGSQGKAKRVTVPLVRDVIRIESVSWANLGKGFLYLKIHTFQEDTVVELENAVKAFQKEHGQDVQGCVLDLRDNPGGLLDKAVGVANKFIKSGIIVSTVGRDPSKQEVEYALHHNSYPFMPMVVLMNGRTASASEIVAGALKDHGRALLVGSTTFGKGSIQSLVPLGGDTGLKITSALYYTPSGHSIQAKGIKPDIPIADRDTESPTQNNPQMPTSTTPRREADLKGHLEPKDLDSSRLDNFFTADVSKWPKHLTDDTHVRAAFTFLGSWERFRLPAGYSPPEGPLGNTGFAGTSGTAHTVPNVNTLCPKSCVPNSP